MEKIYKNKISKILFKIIELESSIEKINEESQNTEKQTTKINFNKEINLLNNLKKINIILKILNNLILLYEEIKKDENKYINKQINNYKKKK